MHLQLLFHRLIAFSYTHFTSPIRRYPDLVVHRLLAASLGYCSPPDYTPQRIERIARNCNEKKLVAKTLSDASDEMFFGLIIKVSAIGGSHSQRL